MKKRTAVYPGSFDPVTFGHLDIIDRASKIFDHVIVGVFVHSAKKHMFPLDQRVAMLRTALKGRKNVTVDCFEGLLVDYMKKKSSKLVIRGLRAISDLEYEFQIAAVNRTLSPEIETVFLMPRQRYTYLSSSIVRDIAHFRGNVSKLVPPHVSKAIAKLKR
ncbi:MAG: pantetheine-phosphate adenylyltransferase [Elusimicrobia bacterium]|nr:pantetheine-phosphate adenylyltransferase [Elusimicrobiota bacterium]